MDRHNIAVVGGWGSVAGFGQLGVDVFVTEDATSARSLWSSKIAGASYAVVFVTERVYEQIFDLVADFGSNPTPAITVIPGAGDSGGVGKEKIRRAMGRALGVSVPSGEEDC